MVVLVLFARFRWRVGERSVHVGIESLADVRSARLLDPRPKRQLDRNRHEHASASYASIGTRDERIGPGLDGERYRAGKRRVTARHGDHLRLRDRSSEKTEEDEESPVKDPLHTTYVNIFSRPDIREARTTP
jgi:hypothetical protein